MASLQADASFCSTGDILREKINFPYYVYHGKYYPDGPDGRFRLGWRTLEYSDWSQMTVVMHTDELERFVTEFLRQNGITR